MDKYLLFLKSPISIAIVVFIVIAIPAVLIWRKTMKNQPIPKKQGKAINITQSRAVSKLSPAPVKGKYNGIILKPGKIVFTKIQAPIGEASVADASLPYSGTSFLVVERKQGQIEDIDPKDEPYEADKSPTQAYICTHCDFIIQDFWTADTKWWQSASNWFAAGMIIADVFAFMAVFGE